MIIKAASATLRPEAPAADIRESVKDIDEEVDRLNRIVHDVLDFAKPPSMLREPADLVRLCQDAASAATVGGGPAIDLEMPGAPLVASTDPDRLRTALINVLSNARQAVDARESALRSGERTRSAAGAVVARPSRQPPRPAARQRSRHRHRPRAPVTGVRAVLHHATHGLETIRGFFFFLFFVLYSIRFFFFFTRSVRVLLRPCKRSMALSAFCSMLRRSAAVAVA